MNAIGQHITHLPDLSSEDSLRPLIDIDLSANPYDIRPAVQAIMSLQNWVIDRIPHGQKVVILFGEIHSFQTHVLLQEAVLRKLHEQRCSSPSRDFAMGYEFAHNFLEKENRDPIPNESYPAAFIRSKNNFHSKEAKDALFQSCLEMEISVSFNDVAIEKSWYGYALDSKNPRTRELVESFRPDLLHEEIPRRSNDRSFSDTDGTGLSNRSLVEGALADMRKKNVDLYVQQCGADHMFGSYFLPYKTSLHSLFSAAGCFVIPVIGCAEYMDAPKQATVPFGNAVKIRGMDEARETNIDYPTVRARIHYATEGLLGLYP